MSVCKRLFVGIPIPKAICDALCSIDLPQPSFRPVASRNMHLTLKFIGEISPAFTANIVAALRPIVFPPFSLTVQGVGTFPARGTPRIVWAGIQPDNPPLFQLQQQVEEALCQIGIAPENRRYIPHITLARCRNVSSNQVKILTQQHQDFALPSFSTECFILYRSEYQRQSSSQGNLYIAEETFALVA